MHNEGTLDTAVGIDWEKTMDKKIIWRRIIVRWLLWLSSWSCGAASRYATRGTLKQKQEWPMKN
jgi:hypothetical protein